MKVFREFLEALALPALVGAALALLWVAGGIRSAAFALFLNAFLMSQVAGSFQVWHITLPESYYRHRVFESNGRLYRWLGIRLFQKLMRSRLYQRLNPDFKLRSHGHDALVTLEQRMRAAETAHLILFALVTLATAIPLAKGWYDAAGWWLLFNLLGNGYPVMLQRYNRARLQPLL